MYDHDLPTRPFPALRPAADELEDSVECDSMESDSVESDSMESESVEAHRAVVGICGRAASDTFEQSFDQTYEDLPPPPPQITVLTTTLPVSADRAFALFADSARTPEWMSVVTSARVLARDIHGHALRTAFVAQMERASLGYTLDYGYDLRVREVRFTTPEHAMLNIVGTARFQELGRHASMMHYDLRVSAQTHLPRWGDDMYNGHPASAVLADFREFVARVRDL